jgi:hypothetical protein
MWRQNNFTGYVGPSGIKDSQQWSKIVARYFEGSGRDSFQFAIPASSWNIEEEVTRRHENLGQYCGLPFRDSNWVPTEHKANRHLKIYRWYNIKCVNTRV